MMGSQETPQRCLTSSRQSKLFAALGMLHDSLNQHADLHLDWLNLMEATAEEDSTVLMHSDLHPDWLQGGREIAGIGMQSADACR